MAELYRVLRTFPGPGGRRLDPGEVVPAGDWRNLSKLVAQGRLIPADQPAPAGKRPKEVPHG